MQKSNRDFYKNDDVILEENFTEFDYNGLSINLFNVNHYENLELQDLDYKFINEIDKNPNRFKVYESKEKFKDWFICPGIFVIILTILSIVIKHVLLPNSSIIVGECFEDLSYLDFSLTVEMFNYILRQSLLFINLIGIILYTLCFLVYLIHKPFFSYRDGKFDVIITDDIGFYLIKYDKSKFYDNGLDKLYFVKYAFSELDLDLNNHICNVSYFSSYSCSMKDSKCYVLDLPNESVDYSNEFDLEFAKKYFNNSDYNELVKYLDETEDN